MRMYSTRSRRRSKRSGKLVWIAIGVTVAVVIIIIFNMRGEDDTPAPDSDEGQAPAAGVTVVDAADKPFENPAAKVDPEAGKPAPGPKGMTRGLAAQIGSSPLTIQRLSREEAEKAYTEGIKLYAAKSDMLLGRKKLNDAYNSGQLHEASAGSAREVLRQIAAQTILHPTPYVNPKDPYTVSYTFASGDRLGSDIRGGRIVRPGVVARNHLNVPVEIIPMVNGLTSATKFQAGKAYKLLKGPFHLVVYKDAKAADIYLQDLFIKRIPICVGALETPTPEGFFRVADRTRNSVYNAPTGSGLPNGTLTPNDPGYPLGPRGLNIKIEGIRQLGTDIPVSSSYAIHGTNDPASISQAASLGCIRLAAADINFVYAIMQSYGDPNSPAVSWDKWSTVWIRK